MPVSQSAKQKVIIIDARDNEEIADEMLRSAVNTLKQQGVEHDRVRVMTLSSIPAAMSIAMEFMEYDGAILLGCSLPDQLLGVEVTRDVMRFIHELAVDFSMPIGFSLIAATSKEEALAEAATRGAKAAAQCLELLRVRSYFLDNSNDDVYHTFNV